MNSNILICLINNVLLFLTIYILLISIIYSMKCPMYECLDSKYYLYFNCFINFLIY